MFPASAAATRQAIETETPPNAPQQGAAGITDRELTGAPATGLAIALVLALDMAPYYFASHMR